MINLKKLINLDIISLISFTSQFLVRIYKRLFAKKTLILISKDKIRNIEINSITQVALVVIAIVVSNLLYQTLMFEHVLKAKSEKIANLQEINNKFRKELVGINANLQKINEYFIASEGYEKDLDATGDQGLHDKKFNDLIANLDLGRNYKKTAIEIANAHVILDNIKNMAKQRIANLEKKIMKTGIVLNEGKVDNNRNDGDTISLSLNTEEELSTQGGPLDLSFGDDNEKNESIDIGAVEMDDEIEYLSSLEKFIYHAPLAKPMKDYYVSSTFGERIDPIRKVGARHNGMDFVGHIHDSKVLSPSVGEIKFAGRMGAYGNAIIIDHGYGISSRYGHLSKINVKVGDIVKKGDILGIQGTTGRSTGAHLHYEVRYNDSPLNPRKFLEAGGGIFGAKEI